MVESDFDILCRATHEGRVDILEEMKMSDRIVTSARQRWWMYGASFYGHVDVLEWWKNSGFLPPFCRVIIWAGWLHPDAEQNEVSVWWRQSGLMGDFGDTMGV